MRSSATEVFDRSSNAKERIALRGTLETSNTVSTLFLDEIETFGSSQKRSACFKYSIAGIMAMSSFPLDNCSANRAGESVLISNPAVGARCINGPKRGCEFIKSWIPNSKEQTPFQKEKGIGKPPSLLNNPCFGYTKNGAITKDTIDISLIKMFIAGPEVSLSGSPTVSPTTVAW